MKNIYDEIAKATGVPREDVKKIILAYNTRHQPKPPTPTKNDVCHSLRTEDIFPEFVGDDGA